MMKQVPLAELQTRMQRFRAEMDATRPDWAIAAVFSKINLYYFTGTMQDGVLLIPRLARIFQFLLMAVVFIVKPTGLFGEKE